MHNFFTMATPIYWGHPSMMMLLLLLLTAGRFAPSAGQSDAQILLNFAKQLSNDSNLIKSWDPLVFPFPCNGSTNNWVGLKCNNDGTINKLILAGMGLTGTVDIDSLVGLTQLRTLSLEFNNLGGVLPPVNKLTSLRNLYMSNNKFSGDIPFEAFNGMNSLVDLEVANNAFTGEIPGSLVKLGKLRDLRLEGNQFIGRIPNFKQPFTEFNVSGNHLVGRIPPGLSSQDKTSFGNQTICGKPLPACKTSKKKTIILIAILAVAVMVVLASVTLIAIRGRRTKSAQLKTAQKKLNSDQTGWKETELPEQFKGKRGETGKLHFVRNDRDRFELQDLLRASAEVLGSGNFGSSYKALLSDGPAMVVKRFRQMNNVGKEDFYEHMRRLGRLSHPNLLPLVAFYYRKEEKLLVSDFIENGSLASHLHAKRAPGQRGLDWPTRLKIIKGVARGLSYLYTEFPTLPLPHGDLKSSNVLLDHTFEPLLTDYALVPVVNKDQAQQVMAAYKSPEFAQPERRTSRKTDVWSLGILILEALTGKFPANYLKQGKGSNSDLATWVNSVVREEWTGEVFDSDMRGTKSGEGEMLKLLKIGMCCCEWNVERRWELREAVSRIDELKERDGSSEGDEFSAYASEGDINSSRAVSEDDFSFSVTR